MLLVEHASSEGIRFFCQLCPYVFKIEKLITSRLVLERKEVDDVMGGAEAWKNVQQTTSMFAFKNQCLS